MRATERLRPLTAGKSLTNAEVIADLNTFEVFPGPKWNTKSCDVTVLGGLQ